MLFAAFVFLLVVVLAIYTLSPKPGEAVLCSMDDHRRKVQEILRQIPPNNTRGYVRSKSNHTYRGKSNLASHDIPKIDMSKLTGILKFSPSEGFVEVEANIRIQALIKWLLKRGHNLNSCPDLGTLTMSGLCVGIGGGNTSWKQGYFHSNCLSVTLLMPNGKVAELLPTHELFRALPGSLGTLGYLLTVRIKIERVMPFVKSNMYHFSDGRTYLDFIQKLMRERESSELTFLDATIFGPREYVVVTGEYRPFLPEGEKLASVKTDVYYELIRSEKELWFSCMDFIYRFDVDLYYTTLSLPKILRSRLLRSMIPKSAIHSIQQFLGRFLPLDISLFCADVLIPLNRSHEFLSWYHEHVGVYPVYNCPVAVPKERQFARHWDDSAIYLDFGLGYGVLPPAEKQRHLGKAVEDRCMELDGKKLPYTNLYMSKSTFRTKYWRDYSSYLATRDKYGFQNFPLLFQKLRMTE